MGKRPAEGQGQVDSVALLVYRAADMENEDPVLIAGACKTSASESVL